MRTKIAAAMARAVVDRGPVGRETVVERLRRGLTEAGLDCDCRETADRVLDGVGAEEELILRASGLADARKMRDAIVVVIALLGELDELMPDEPDRTAFHEIAGLFQDVAEFATSGAEAARRAAGKASG